VLDRDGVLWLTGEHYETQKPLSYHVRFLPKDVRWYADPSGPAEIEELKCGGFAVSAGENALRLGIAAVAARVENGTLKVLAGACPNLLREASLYRYSDDPLDRRSETPVDAHNHALAALRYMVAKIDAHQLGRMAKKAGGEAAVETEDQLKKRQKQYLSYGNEDLWTRIW
jgi:hypothetical protein